jgi:hypothetical protein
MGGNNETQNLPLGEVVDAILVNFFRRANPDDYDTGYITRLVTGTVGRSHDDKLKYELRKELHNATNDRMILLVNLWERRLIR